MPGKVKVKVIAGRNLPIMDRSSDTTDAYVEVKFGNITHKTDVFRKSLNPQWNSDWFRFEVDDSELQDEPLQIRIMDYDTYSANDAIGKVYLDLNPLLLPSATASRGHGWSEGSLASSPGGAMLSGWLPVFDTMHGMRGEVSVIVKVELFSDVNKFRQSSCGVQFFCTPTVPCGFRLQHIHGFVKELVVNDDPEYQWIDKVRTSRASNEARQTLISQLSGEVRRRIGLKVIELGGNAVIGYQQTFDLEGETGIVVRGIGTAVTLTRSHVDATLTPLREAHGGRESPRERPLPLEHKDSRQTLNNNLANSPAACTPGRPTPCRRRSSDSEISVTPKGASLPESVGSCGGGGGITPQANSRPPPRQSSAPVPPAGYASLSEASVMDMLEFPFFTMKKYPAGFIVHMGGTVSARSVKLLNQIKDSEEPETRDNWWTEIRMEIRSNARALGCNVILGYEEHTTICEEVCVLSVSGTAALVNLQLHEVENVPSGKEPDHKKDINKADLNNSKGSSAVEASDEVRGTLNSCRVCHIPYSKSSIPFPVKLSRCAICRKGRVPDILVATIDPPEGVSFTGRGCFLQARLCRARKDESRGDSQAKEISDSLPFLEYELHCQLIKKLRLKGMNAIFGLKVQVSIGEKHMVGVATGTAAYLTSLPRPVPPTVTSTNPSADEARLIKIRKLVMENFLKNQEIYGLKTSPKSEHDSEKNDRAAVGNNNSDSEESEDDVNELDLAAGNKDTFVLEIDDAKDADIVDLLIEPRTPEGVIVVTTESVPGLVTKLQRREIQAVTRVWRGRLPAVLSSRSFNECFEFILQSVYFKLRKMRPCVLTHVQFNVDLPEEDVIQITVLGNAVSQSAALPPTSSVPILPVKTGCESEMIFHLEEDTHGLSESASALCQSKLVSTSSVCGSRPLGERSKNSNQRDRHFVDITSLSRLPGARIERYLGHLNFFFIRESTSIREDGGLSGFMQSFITEVLAMVRAHVAALGGNAMVAYFMTECVLLHSPHKNQGQCLINVGGDVVSVTREKEA